MGDRDERNKVRANRGQGRVVLGQDKLGGRTGAVIEGMKESKSSRLEGGK